MWDELFSRSFTPNPNLDPTGLKIPCPIVYPIGGCGKLLIPLLPLIELFTLSLGILVDIDSRFILGTLFLGLLTMWEVLAEFYIV